MAIERADDGFHHANYASLHGSAECRLTNFLRLRHRVYDLHGWRPEVRTGRGTMVELVLPSGEIYFQQKVYDSGRFIDYPFFQRRLQGACYAASLAARELGLYRQPPSDGPLPLINPLEPVAVMTVPQQE
jgi:hypothetical protein